MWMHPLAMIAGASAVAITASPARDARLRARKPKGLRGCCASHAPRRFCEVNMSNRLLSGLLALYPAQFRREFGAECVGLLRDRFRDERGLMARTRLCADVLNDLVFGVPRLYAPARRALATPASAQV